MSAATPVPGDDDLKGYILETIKRLDRLAERLEVFAEEQSGDTTEGPDQPT